MSVKEQLNSLLHQLNEEDVTLVAISKKKPVEDIRSAYEAGQKIFGENRAQELVKKRSQLPEDIQWHMVGHLQRNKVKKIAPFVSLIHSLDSLRLAKEIDKRAQQNERVIDCLLQIHIAQEKSKYGFAYEEVEELLQDKAFQNLTHIRIRGVMGMASFTGNTEQVGEEFKSLNTFFKKLKQEYFAGNDHFSELSMGMTNDWKIALEEGSTMVRIGRLIFGER